MNPTFSPQEILEKLRKLCENKGWWPEEIPRKILKYSKSVLAGPICELLNASLTTCVFPDTLKKAYVVPIHKSGPIDIASNYRLTSILCALAKLFEDLFLDLMKHKVASIICPQQHGFIAGRPTVSNLIFSQSKILEAKFLPKIINLTQFI